MGWPAGADLPTVSLMVFFLVACGMFLKLAVSTPHHRMLNAYHAWMMAAMARMNISMDSHLRHAPSTAGSQVSGHSGHCHDHAAHAHDATMAKLPDTASSTVAPGASDWLPSPELVLGAAFAVAAGHWFVAACRGVRLRRMSSIGGGAQKLPFSLSRTTGMASHATMAAGMSLVIGAHNVCCPVL
ncbi:hypothetical protein ASE01_17065 [Nocardioides sp. Root190]|uniref:DUF5134 domain-containing protein n=1 Tax=Nocardioides sp. Root190 TaxID=1736488 RepID=UPI0006F4D830|nr:DUF5134 domain-containing protein [Nocardioides sp. Root190]KRB75074.1 hypothetical protein ASE01_17065 [Nocardioides sp. Root190]